MEIERMVDFERQKVNRTLWMERRNCSVGIEKKIEKESVCFFLENRSVLDVFHCSGICK